MRTLFHKANAKLSAFWADTSGATAIEYGLIAVGLSIVIIATVFAVGDELDEMFQWVVDDYLAQANADASS